MKCTSSVSRRCTALHAPAPQRKKKSKSRKHVVPQVEAQVEAYESSQVSVDIYVPRWQCVTTGEVNCLECSLLLDGLDEEDCVLIGENLPDPCEKYWDELRPQRQLISDINLDNNGVYWVPVHNRN